MYNRRLYERIDINVECVLYLKDGEVMEINGLLRDISENGIGLFLEGPEEVFDVLKEKMNLKFQFQDEFMIFKEICSHIVNGQAEIVRLQRTEDGMIVGCRLLQPEKVEAYVRERKMASYLDSMQRFDT